jgi:hypothetical protein
MGENDLSDKEVGTVVYSYKDAGVTDQLYAFGSSLLSDAKGRSEHIMPRRLLSLAGADPNPSRTKRASASVGHLGHKRTDRTAFGNHVSA